MGDVQYRLAVAKSDERIEGPDDAEIVFTAPLAAVDSDEFCATAEFMRGRLKGKGDTGRILDLLKAGSVTEAFERLAAEYAER